MRAVDERERDKDVWLDPLTRGSELHDLYAVLLRRTRDANRRPNKDDGAWLMARASERLQQLNEEMPAATQEILERESQGLPGRRRAVPRRGIRGLAVHAHRLRSVVRASAG